MAKCSIGKTTSGKHIYVEIDVPKSGQAPFHLAEFSECDALDALLAVECLILRESRREIRDVPWLESLTILRRRLVSTLVPERIAARKAELGIDSAFSARDYGRSLLYPHFR